MPSANGGGLALVPGTPTLVLEPDLALTLLVAPVLLDAAFDSSARDLRANWRTVAGLAVGAVVLTVVVVVLAFILVGFQLKAILGRIDAPTLGRYAGVAVAVCLATILARFAWVSGSAALSRWRCRPAPDGSEVRRDAVGLSGRAAAIVGWCGMRGIVTLAAALALPAGGGGAPEFPYRDLVVFTAGAGRLDAHQPTTVSGFTTTRTSAQRDRTRRRATQKTRSAVRMRGRPF
jgi:NhaP-type Na+/H+ or K+/H+ antiporter